MALFGTDLASPHGIVERALKKPASTIWLGHVCLPTTRFEEAIAFYVGTLGLSLRTVEGHPSQPERLRALLIDAEGRDVLELVETEGPDPEAPPFRQLSFRLPQRAWQLLRARLVTQDYPYKLAGRDLLLRDRDGVALRIEALGEC